jgi:hypothetical protein
MAEYEHLEARKKILKEVDQIEEQQRALRLRITALKAAQGQGDQGSASGLS